MDSDDDSGVASQSQTQFQSQTQMPTSQPDDFQELDVKSQRRIYLVTYSQADTQKFPDAHSFGLAVATAFDNATGTSKVQHWACSKERHPETGGFHYHATVSLTRGRRWLSVKNSIMDEHGIVVHFRDNYSDYYTAWQYIVKDLSAEQRRESSAVYHQSDGHLDLTTVGYSKSSAMNAGKQRKQTTVTTTDDGHGRESTVRQTKTTTSSSSDARRKSLNSSAVADYVISNNLKSADEFMYSAKRRHDEGQDDLYDYILSRPIKRTRELIDLTWQMEEVQDRVERAAKSRMDILQDASVMPCECAIPRQWTRCALELLFENGLDQQEYCNALRTALEKGRGKGRNMMLVGPANCGKTFMLAPLMVVFKTFSNPATTTYSLVGAELAEVIFLNDFRYEPVVIGWGELLNMLEGQLVRLPAPKTHYSCDLVLDKDTPIFATSKDPITHVDERERQMMNCRWKVFRFTFQIPEEQQKQQQQTGPLKPCGSCFSQFVLRGIVQP